MTLEDEFGDVVRKARTGLSLSREQVARRTGLSAAALEATENYQLVPEEAVLARLAAVLGLRVQPLAELAHRRYEPAAPPLELLGGAAMVRSDYGGGVVNCYAVWDGASGEGALFDTGVDFDALEQLRARHGFEVRYVFITHTHGDHIGALAEARRRWQPKVVGSRHEPIHGAQLVKGDAEFGVGRLRIAVLATPGHSPGGLSFRAGDFGAGRPALCMCGDTLFAGSAGRPMQSYDLLLRSVRETLLGMEEATILCPGHGPLTTVGQEKLHNPFA
ncbi:MAG: MBL fold metallo-hydrolase [Verrucomicrobia bacterium]|nr:MBL fold metallo-hydrolase [Verrucomicrobiota bacterium]